MRKDTDKRITATIDEKTYDIMSKIAEQKNISISELLREAIDLEIRYANEDYYPLARIEAERINQLTDYITALGSNMKNLENLVIEGFASLINITKGDNYLFDEDEEN